MYHFILRALPRPLLIKVSLKLKPIADHLLRGDRFFDPINNKGYRYFLPYGRNRVSIRKNVLSPGTLSLERHRLMWLVLKKKTDFFSNKSNKKLLHIAPEQCFYNRFRALENLEYVTADLDSPIADVKMDLHKIPFEDDRFNIVFCNHVLEHVEDDIQCMSELYRVMKKGGWGIFQVPIDINSICTLEEDYINTPALRDMYYRQKDHMRLYGLDYPDRLKMAGFDVERIELESVIPRAEWGRYMVGNEPFYIFHKR